MLGWAEMLSVWPEVPRSYNVTPSALVASFTGSGGQAMRWGMVPAWSKEFDSKYATFNARIETVADKATFKHAWKKNQRCLIPMRGYYEWQASSGGKQPFYISAPNIGGLVAAGLYEPWSKNDVSCTMITRPADPGLDEVHGRMPVLLTPQNAQRWLFEDTNQAFLIDLKAPEVVVWPVSKEVGNVNNNYEGLSQEIDLSTSVKIQAQLDLGD